jgi:hypothetical protein
MDSHRNDFESLQGRLTKLENQNRRFTQLGIAGLVGITLLLLMGQAPAKKNVDANEFILRDDNGNLRARLFVTEKNTTNMTIPGVAQPIPVTSNPEPMLALYDEKGQARVLLGDDSITFIKSHISLGYGVLTMGDQTNGVVVSPYSIGLFDEQGFETTLGRRALATSRTGETHMTSAASLVMLDKSKNVIWKAP